LYAKFGTYAFANNSIELRVSHRPVLNDGGQPVEMMKRVDVMGYLDGEGAAAISQAASALVTALSIPYQDFLLYQDDNTPSDTSLYNAGSLTGVVVKDIDFPDGRAGEYVTYRKFRFAVEASYPFNNTQSALRSFHERITRSGGGYRDVWRPSLNGTPQRQRVYRATVYTTIQEGQAVGFLATPLRPPPKWPQYLVEANPQTSEDSPERRGNLYTDFAISWRYEFQSDVPLLGAPTFWRG
jgi:hypothetical protein